MYLTGQESGRGREDKRVTGLVGSVGTAVDGRGYVNQLEFNSCTAFIGWVVTSSVALTSRHIITLLLFVGCDLFQFGKLDWKSCDLFR